MAPDIAKLRSDQQKIERTLERNRSVLDDAIKDLTRYDRTLTASGSEAASARSDLRKVGYLVKKNA